MDPAGGKTEALLRALLVPKNHAGQRPPQRGILAGSRGDRILRQLAARGRAGLHWEIVEAGSPYPTIRQPAAFPRRAGTETRPLRFALDPGSRVAMSVSEWTRLAGERKRARARLLVPDIARASDLPARRPSQNRAAIELPARGGAGLRGEIVEAGSPYPAICAASDLPPEGGYGDPPATFCLAPRISGSHEPVEPNGPGWRERSAPRRPRTLLVPRNRAGQRLPARHPSQDRAAIESFGSLPRGDALAYVGKS